MYHSIQEICANRLCCTLFFVDNLIIPIITNNHPEQLQELYAECNKRMREGGLVLSSWNSNSNAPVSTTESDNLGSTHGSEFEKILGYRYKVSEDIFEIIRLHPGCCLFFKAIRII